MNKRLSWGRVAALFAVTLITMAITAFVAYNIEAYIRETLEFVAPLTYSVIGLIIALIFTVFILRQDSALISAAGLGLPFTALYLFSGMIFSAGSNLSAVFFIVLGAVILTVIRLKGLAPEYTVTVLFLTVFFLSLLLTGTDIRETFQSLGLILF